MFEGLLRQKYTWREIKMIESESESESKRKLFSGTVLVIRILATLERKSGF